MGKVVRAAGLLLACCTHNPISSSGEEKKVRTIKQPEPEQVKRMNLNVPIELHNAFKSVTAAEGQNMTDVLLDFIQKYVADHPSPKTRGRRK